MFKNFYLNVEFVHPNAKIPTRGYSGDAGLDLYAIETTIIWPGNKVLIPIGIKTEFPEGYYAQILDRGSMANKGIHCIAGVMDAGYRGEYFIQMVNFGKDTITIRPGDKIAQFVIIPVWNGQPTLVNSVNNSERGDGALGSSGV